MVSTVRRLESSGIQINKSLSYAEPDSREACLRHDEMENRIKECQLDLFADRASAATMRANQIRLWLASLAYVLVAAVRRLGLEGAELARATAGTIRMVY